MREELGIVHYLTTELYFPHDKDKWVKQEPIAGASNTAIAMFIRDLDVPVTAKQDLSLKRHTSWKDNNGVWITLRIETTVRNRKWGNLTEIVRNE